MSILISIVVPVYNSEKVLEKNLKSIIPQKGEDIEIILVDDGSTDSSYEICKMYAGEYENIKVKRTGNHGVSHARNVGKQIACGDYIWFVDSDDYISDDSIHILKSIILSHHSDVIFFNPVFEKQNGAVISFPIKNIEPNHEFGRDEISDRIIPWMLGYTENQKEAFAYADSKGKVIYSDCYNAPWQALYRRETISVIDFDENLNIYEDLLFNIEVMAKVDSVYYIENPLYHYVSNSNGLATKYHPQYIDMKLLLFHKIVFSLKKSGYCDNVVNLLSYRIYDDTISVFINECRGSKRGLSNIRRYFADNLVQESLSISKRSRISHQIIIWLIRHKMYAAVMLIMKIRIGAY